MEQQEEPLGGIHAGIRAHRPEAWTRLYALAHLPILRMLRRMLKDAARAEDALQAAFVTAVERVKDFDPAKGNADAWLAGIARYKALELLRERHGMPMGADPPDPLSLPSAAPLGDSELVAAALDSLEPRYTEVLRRKYWVGQSVEEIALALGMKTPTVATLLFRGRARFREAYDRLSGGA